MILNNLLSQKLALESQWNSMYTNTGIYSVAMTAIQQSIYALKSLLQIPDHHTAKSSRTPTHHPTVKEEHSQFQLHYPTH